MWTSRRSLLLTAVLGISTSAQVARADQPDLTLSFGYSKVWLDGAGPPFDKQDGGRTEIRFTGSPFEEIPQLRLGGSLAFAGYSQDLPDRDRGIVVIDDGDVFIFRSDDYESLSFIVPEFQVSWKQALGDYDGSFFIEPGLGLGVPVGNYSIGSTWWGDDVSEWDATVAARPFVRAGYQNEVLNVGLEASYLLGGKLDFTDRVSGDLQQAYVGFFIGMRF